MFQDFVASVQRFTSSYDPLSTGREEALHSISQHLPGSYTLQQLYESLIFARPTIADSGNLLAIDSCLSDQDRIRRSEGDLIFSAKICMWAASKIVPGPSLVIQNEYPAASRSELHERIVSEFRMLVCSGVSIISRLDTIVSATSTLDDTTLLSLLSFTDERDPWTTSCSYEIAENLLLKYKEYTTSHEFLIERLVKTTIRPLFQKSKPSTITNEGRKAINQDAPDRYPGRTTDVSSKPWKFEQPATITLFRWAVKNTSVATFSESWHLFAPPLLTIIDDPNTEIRARGCELLVRLLEITPGRLLKQTGLGDVFEEAIMPTLLYLPSLTPVDDSLRLLPPAYSALYALADTIFSEDPASPEKIKLLDRILRQGVLRGYFHAMENVRIIEVLIHQTGVIVQKMGLDAVKHLKDIIPVLVGVLTDPLGYSHLENLLVATKTTQLIILSCWPRVSKPTYRVQLVQALTLCWNGLSDPVVTDTSGAEHVRIELRVAARLLLKSIEPGTDIQQEFQLLLEVDSTLPDLFGIYPPQRQAE